MRKSIVLIGCMALLLAVGCASNKKKLSYADYPVYTYEQPYDLVYKKALDILSDQPGWILETTDKNEGIIRLASTQYANILDMDTQKGQFVVKMVSRKETSIEFDPEHSNCRDNNCRIMLQGINKVLKELPPHIEIPKNPAQQ